MTFFDLQRLLLPPASRASTLANRLGLVEHTVAPVQFKAATSVLAASCEACSHGV